MGSTFCCWKLEVIELIDRCENRRWSEPRGTSTPILGNAPAGTGRNQRSLDGRVPTPQKPEDFQQRSWIPHSGWPIGRDDLDIHYEAAHRLLELGPYDYRADVWSDSSHIERPAVFQPIRPVGFPVQPAYPVRSDVRPTADFKSPCHRRNRSARQPNPFQLGWSRHRRRGA